MPIRNPRRPTGKRTCRPRWHDALAALDDETAARLVGWRPAPRLWRDTSRDVSAVMDHTRLCVALTGPPDWKSVVGDMWPAFLFLAWCEETIGDISPETAFVPHNVNCWVGEKAEEQEQEAGWLRRSRAVLRGIGRVVNPAAWPPDEQIGGRATPAAYSPDQEAALRLAAGLPGRSNPASMLATAALTLGTGFRGSEVARVGPADLVERDDGRLAVNLPGADARLVPVREPYTALLRRAVEARPSGLFISGSAKNAPYVAAQRIQVHGMGYLSLARARSTWLTAHLLGGTPLPHLRVIAGPLSAHTLTQLMAASAPSVDPDEAVKRGLEI